MAPIVIQPGSTGGRRRPWLRWLTVVLLVLVPIVEIFVLVQVAQLVGVLPTVLLLIALCALGGWLLRREGRRTWRAFGEAVGAGKVPNREIADAVLVFVGGALLVVPGFVTAVIGLLLVLPFTRPIARIGLEVLVARRLLAAGVGGEVRVRRTRRGGNDDDGGDVVEGEIIDDD